VWIRHGASIMRLSPNRLTKGDFVLDDGEKEAQNQNHPR